MRTFATSTGRRRNYGWCFDCVPEENSLLLGIGACRLELPSIDLVFDQPRALLGEEVQGRFGDEFPIRFDLLDTMGGGNLSFQVHPLTEYIQHHFGMHYTQDESYYLLDAAPGACVYLGLREGVDPAAMARDLRAAQAGGPPFPADRYANRWPREEARPLPDSRRHRPLFGRQLHGAGNQRHALHLHFQVVGLGPHGPRRDAAADPSRARPGATSRGIGRQAGWSAT